MAKFFWNYLRINPSFEPSRLSPISRGDVTEGYKTREWRNWGALQWQEWFLLMKTKGHPETRQVTDCNFIFFAEHEPVYAYPPKIQAALYDSEQRSKYLKVNNPRKLPAPLFRLPENHGGLMTYHGPGQLVCYLVLCLEDVGLGIGDLSKVIDSALKDVLKKLDVIGCTLAELAVSTDKLMRKRLISQAVLTVDDNGKIYENMSAQGIWVAQHGEARKIASRGLRAVAGKGESLEIHKKHFTLYGFSLNISPDLSYFENYIYPCGLDIEMTSVQQLTGKKHNLPKVAKMLAEALVQKIKEVSGDNSHTLM